MGLGLKGCIRSQFSLLEAAISRFPLRTTASPVADSASCCR
ncbi:unnamed protein product [Brassica oleracea]